MKDLAGVGIRELESKPCFFVRLLESHTLDLGIALSITKRAAF